MTTEATNLTLDSICNSVPGLTWTDDARGWRVAEGNEHTVGVYWDDADPANEGWAYALEGPDGYDETGEIDDLGTAREILGYLLEPEPAGESFDVERAEFAREGVRALG